MPKYTRHDLIRKGYIKYPYVFDNWYDAKVFSNNMKKYRYFSNWVKIGDEYVVFYKKKSFTRAETSKVMKKKQYSDKYIHWFGGVKNLRDFKKYNNKYFDYTWEWNIFAIKDELNIWNVRFTNYNITFGDIKRFSTEKEMEKYIDNILKENSYGLWHISEYEDIF